MIYFNKKSGALTKIPIGNEDKNELRKAPIVRLEAFSHNENKYIAIGTGGEGVFIKKVFSPEITPIDPVTPLSIPIYVFIYLKLSFL